MGFAATDSPDENRRIARTCADRGILVNVADEPGLCDFFVPAVVRRGSLAVAVSTAGKSPMLARTLKEDLEEYFGEEYGAFVDMLGAQRERIMRRVADRQQRRKLFEVLAASDRLKLPQESDEQQHSWYLYTVRLQNATESERNTIVEELRRKNVGAEAYYIHPVHLMPYYRENFGEYRLPETKKAAQQVFSLPIHPGVTKAQVEYIGKTLLSLL